LGCITTYPTVVYQALPRGEEQPVEVYNPLEAPENVDVWFEPWAEAKILCKIDFLDNIKRVCEARRGLMTDYEDTDDGQFLMTYEFPMSEIITDFVDIVKTNSKGYASLDYEFLEYREADIEKVVIYITNEPIDALSFLVHKKRAFDLGKKICIKLRDLVPRQLFDVKIQARIRNKTIASESIKSTGKNVLAKCYGGDYSRKRKLIEKQKSGKKKMRELGRVSVPTNTLNKIFK
jgi:GTP-binding protein LepA